MNRAFRRKIGNVVALSLSAGATLIGLACLGAILWTLLSSGLSGMGLHVFTQMTPPPGSAGGLLNAIYGSLIMTAIGIAIGTPIGIMAGTYLAEYGANTRLSDVIRVVNDVLLPAPSLIALGVLLFLITFSVIAIARFMLMRLERRALSSV